MEKLSNLCVQETNECPIFEALAVKATKSSDSFGLQVFWMLLGVR